MSDDICDRLMRFAGKVCLSTDTEVEAADEIERLRAENAKFREAELIFSKDGQKWRTAISIFKEQDAKIDKLENIIEDDAKLILRVRMENEKLRAALKDCESEMRSIVSYIRCQGKWAHDSGILLNMLRKADAASAALKETGDE